MENVMNDASSAEKQKAKKRAWIVTIVYLILFPFLLMFAWTSFMIFGLPNMPIALGLGFILSYFLMPLSIPCTLYLVWSRYMQGEYLQSKRYCLIPLYVIGAALIYSTLMDRVIDRI